MRSATKVILPLTFSGLLIIGVCLWINDKTADFGINFTTEVLGVLITVYLIDYLIRKRDRFYFNDIGYTTNAFLLKICDRIICTYYPDEIEKATKVIKYKFGNIEILSYQNSFPINRVFSLSVEDKTLFEKHIIQMYGSDSFLDKEKLFSFLIKEFNEIYHWIEIIQQATSNANRIGEKDIYCLGHKLYYSLFCYLELRDTVFPRHKNTAFFMAEYHIPIINSAVELKRELIKNSEYEELLDLNKYI